MQRALMCTMFGVSVVLLVGCRCRSSPSSATTFAIWSAQHANRNPGRSRAGDILGSASNSLHSIEGQIILNEIWPSVMCGFQPLLRAKCFLLPLFGRISLRPIG